MNDRDQIDDVEPLDASSMGLLAAYRRAQGPSEDAQARMLAGLRARIADEDAPATAVTADATPTPAADARPRTSPRTVVVAAIAFAAGVGLTLALADRTHPEAGDGAAPHIVKRAPARAGRMQPGDVATAEHVGAASSGAQKLDPAAEAERPWPLSVAELAIPAEPGEAGAAEDPEAEPRRVEALGADPEPTPSHGPSSASPPREPTPSRPEARGTGAAPPRVSSTGAWVPPLSPTAPSPAFGPSTHGPGAPSPTPTPSGSPGRSGPATGAPPESPAGDAAAGDRQPDPPPADEPPPGPDPDEDEQPDPEPEPDEDEQPDEDAEEPPLEERCDTELQLCIADADAYCGWSPEGCSFVHEFCHERMEACMNDEPMAPYPEHPEPGDPMPVDCYDDYEMCMMDTEAICVFDKAPPDVCEEMYWQCEDMLTACEGEPPPMPPPMPPG